MCSFKTHGNDLQYVKVCKYLGISFYSRMSFGFCLELNRRSFYRSFNCSRWKLKLRDCEIVTMHLLNSICLPSLIYGVDTAQLKAHDIKRLQSCINTAIMNTFRLYSLDNIQFISSVFDVKPLEDIFEERFNCFLRRYMESVEALCII